MSDNILQVLPAAPTFRPTKDAARAVVAALAQIAPGDTAKEIGPGPIAFVDAGSNFESIHCPHCRAEIEIGWWARHVDAAQKADFYDLIITTPCCSKTTSLNDLDYIWPQGFAGWWVEILNPNRGQLTDNEVDALGAAMGCAVRIVWTHI